MRRWRWILSATLVTGAALAARGWVGGPTPSNSVAVVDHSGSVSGESVDLRQGAIDHLYRRRRGDGAALLAVGSDVERLWGPRRVAGAADVERLQQLVRDLEIDRDGFGTALPAALREAIRALHELQTLSPSGIPVCLLFTDGRADRHEDAWEPGTVPAGTRVLICGGEVPPAGLTAALRAVGAAHVEWVREAEIPTALAALERRLRAAPQQLVGLLATGSALTLISLFGLLGTCSRRTSACRVRLREPGVDGEDTVLFLAEGQSYPLGPRGAFLLDTGSTGVLSVCRGELGVSPEGPGDLVQIHRAGEIPRTLHGWTPLCHGDRLTIGPATLEVLLAEMPDPWLPRETPALYLKGGD